MVMTQNGWADLPEDEREALDVYDHTDAASSPMLEPVELAEKTPTLLAEITNLAHREATRLRIAEWRSANKRFDERVAAEMEELVKHDPFDDSFTPEVSDF